MNEQGVLGELNLYIDTDTDTDTETDIVLEMWFDEEEDF